MRRLFNLKMAEGSSGADHLNEFNTVTAQFSSVEIKFYDKVRALILLSSLSKSWNGTVTMMSNSSGKSKLNFNDVRDLILSEEIRRKELRETSGSALNTETRTEKNTNRKRSKSKHRSKSRT